MINILTIGKENTIVVIFEHLECIRMDRKYKLLNT